MQCEVAIGWFGRFLSLDKTGDLSCSIEVTKRFVLCSQIACNVPVQRSHQVRGSSVTTFDVIWPDLLAAQGADRVDGSCASGGGQGGADGSQDQRERNQEQRGGVGRAQSEDLAFDQRG